MDQSLDNDDDVIVLPNDTQVITEILDDEEEELRKTQLEQQQQSGGGDGTSFPEGTEKRHLNESQESDVEIQERFIPTATLDGDTSNITMPLPGVVRIKTEPKDDGYNEEDAFMDVGTIEPVDDEDEPMGDGVDDDNHAAVNDDRSNGGVERDLNAAFDEEASILTVDTSEGNRQSPETIALDSPLTPATGLVAQQHEQLGLDGNLEENVPVVTIAPNKIKINISKLASASVQAEGNTDSRDSVHSALQMGGETSCDASRDKEAESRAASPELEIEFEYKDTMKGVEFVKKSPVMNGIETSGLCSIM